MLRLIDITFHANTEYTDTSALLAAQQTSLIYIEAFKQFGSVDVVKHYTNDITIHPRNGYHFFRAKNQFGYFSLEAMRFIKKRKPDIIIVSGLIFPIQVIFLRLLLGNTVKIIARHHADKPFSNPKRILQVIADKCIAAYRFTAAGNAVDWVKQGVISDVKKIIEIPATLTQFIKQDKAYSRKQTGMPEGINFLWVGRLNSNKDPLTVISAFDHFLQTGHRATLHLIFQTADLLEEIKTKISESHYLQNAVRLQGHVNYNDLPFWYSAADFYISASHSEGGSSAILEAMCCGCIPIVSSIPASMKVIADGRYGLFFTPGNSNELLFEFIRTTELSYSNYSYDVETHYRNHYSPEAIARQFFSACNILLSR